MNRLSPHIAALRRLLPFCLLVLLVGCGPRSDTRPTLAVSIEPQRYLLERIVGDKFDVVCLLRPGTDPESYEPGMADMMALERSCAYLTMGHIGFEAALLERVGQNNPDLPVMDTGTGIGILRADHGGEEIDPHVWTSVANARLIARNMTRVVTRIDPDNRDYYERRHDRLCADLDRLESDIAAMLDTCRGRAFMVWHPSLSYFARDHVLRQVALEQDGKEPSVAGLRVRLEQARGSGARVFLCQPEADARLVEAVAGELGLTLVPINPMNPDWEREMRHIAQAIATGR